MIGKRTLTIHHAYAESTPKIPGEYLGTHSGYTRMNPGDIVTCVSRSGGFGSDAYYFDPEMLIEGTHYEWGGLKTTWTMVFPDAFVQVDYSGELTDPEYATLYTYRDPSGTLRIGDEVEVPVTYGTKVGTVLALGKGDWDGTVKDVKARITRTAL